MEENKVYIVVQGNYALSSNMNAFSTRELAESFRDHVRKESKNYAVVNIHEMVVDMAVLKEEDL